MSNDHWQDRPDYRMKRNQHKNVCTCIRLESMFIITMLSLANDHLSCFAHLLYTDMYTDMYVYCMCMYWHSHVNSIQFEKVFISSVYWTESANTIKLLLLQQLVLKEQIHIQCSHGGSNRITQIHFRETINIDLFLSFSILFLVWFFLSFSFTIHR